MFKVILTIMQFSIFAGISHADTTMLKGRLTAEQVQKRKTESSLLRQFWTEEWELQKFANRYVGFPDSANHASRTMTLNEVFEEARQKALWLDQQLEGMPREGREVVFGGKKILLKKEMLTNLQREYRELMEMKTDFEARYSGQRGEFFRLASDDIVYGKRTPGWAGGAKPTVLGELYSGAPKTAAERVQEFKARLQSKRFQSHSGDWRSAFGKRGWTAAGIVLGLVSLGAYAAEPETTSKPIIYDTRVEAESVEESPDQNNK